MKKALLLIAIIALCGTSSVQAQHRHRGHGWGQRMIEKKQQQLPQAPAFLKKGDKVAVLSPSSVPTKLEIIDKGEEVLKQWGFEVVEGRHARTNYHTYAGTPEQLAIHGNMCGRLAETGGTDQPSLWLRDMLMGNIPTYQVPGNALNHPGKASGILIGGNMCVYGDIADTPYDFLDRSFIDGRDIILFIEEVEEPYSRIDRMFQHLILRGVMSKIKALVVGRFDGCPASRGYNSVYEFIEEYVKPYNIPICYDFPTGHDESWNYPLIEGCPVTLDVTRDKVTMAFNLP